jgi:AAA domain/Bifunctional DNA primase/polymerase, N-terminal
MSLLDDALTLASSGYPVFPCLPTKRPATAHGFKDATRDAATITVLFAETAGTLLAVPTGEASGFDVLDIDPRHGGLDWEHIARLPNTHTTRTLNGGFHYRFLHAPGVRNSASLIAEGIDIRGDGGYVIAAPSPGYEVVDHTEAVHWPNWLLALVLARDPPERPKTNGHAPAPISSARLNGFVSSLQARVRAAPEGGKHYQLRNAALSLGGIMDQAGITEADALQRLLSALPEGVADWANAEKTARWGLSRGRERPIELEDRPLNGKPAPFGVQAPNPSSQPINPSSDTSDAAETSASDDLPLVYFPDIQPNLDAADFVEGLLIEGAMSVIYGESNSGKTFFATDLAFHIATGREWCGRAVERSAVIYCALEGRHGIFNRIAALRAHHGPTEADLAVIPSSINLLDPDADVGRLIRAIKAAAAYLKLPVRWVVVDTLSRALAGGNENAPDDMGALVINTDRIRQETGAHVCFVHHSGKDTAKGARGHSLLRAATDTEIEVTDDEGNRNARVSKQRELECTGNFQFQLQVVELGANRRGKQVSSCVVVHGEPSDDQPKRKPRFVGHTKRAFEILTNLLAKEGKSGYDGAPPEALSVPDEWWRERFYQDAMPGDSQDTKKRAFRRAADTLIDCNSVAMANGRVWMPYGERE